MYHVTCVILAHPNCITNQQGVKKANGSYEDPITLLAQRLNINKVDMDYLTMYYSEHTLQTDLTCLKKDRKKDSFT